MASRCAVGAFVVLAGLVARAAAQVSEADLLAAYAGDGPYLNNWNIGTFTNFPPNYWVNNLASTICPQPGLVGWQGISCVTLSDGLPYTSGIDLSGSSLPDGRQKLKSPQMAFDIIGLIALESLDLSNNLISGNLPKQLSLAPKLQRLLLSSNNFSGQISTELCSLNLTCLQLNGNRFRGRIPSCWRHIPCVDFEGSGLKYRPGVDCNNGTTRSSCAPPEVVLAPPPASGGLSTGAIVGIVVGSLVGIALIVAAVVLLIRRRERKRKEEAQKKLAADIETQISTRHFGTLRRFTAPELSKACNDFDEDNLLGEGGFSRVYKGTLDDGKTVAIKKIKNERKAGGELEFLNEVEMISRAVHRNLMHSEGFCVEAGECMLVLPFYPNGSVASRTHGKEGNPLEWPARQRIARGAAEGVAYLHTDCSPKLIHRDIKADNVLLDDGDESIIADFGLAKEMDVKETHRTTAVKGTIGHIAPEYFVSGQCSEKTDVYAFGVFLLELVSGKDVYGLTAAPEAAEMLLRDWVASIVKENKLELLLDPELQGAEETEEAEVVKMLQVALLCMQADPNERPTMEQVAKMLVGKGLAERWQKWQDEAGTMSKEEVMQVISTPAIWENTTTGVTLEGFEVKGPR